MSWAGVAPINGVVPPPSPATHGTEGSALAELRGLLGVAKAMRTGDSLTPVLEAIARVIAGSLGFATVAVNLHRPAFDDFEVVVVHGD